VCVRFVEAKVSILDDGDLSAGVHGEEGLRLGLPSS
jgi:hypothetical protein